MIDTVTLMFNKKLNDKELIGWECKTHENSKGRKLKYIFNAKARETKASLQFTYYPFSYNSDEGLLLLTFSLAKLYFGNNHTLITDLDGAIQTAQYYIDKYSPIPGLDIRHAKLSQLDVVCHYQAGDLLPDYLHVLRQLDYPHRNKDSFDNKPIKGNRKGKKKQKWNGVWFYSKKTICKFYDKGKECGQAAAQGLLRHETTLRGKRNLSKWMGEDYRLKDVTRATVKKILENDLKQLGLKDTAIWGTNSLLSILCNEFGSSTGLKYFGYMVFSDQHPDISVNDFAVMMGIKPRTIKDWRRKLKGSGITPAAISDKKDLPQLTVEY